MFFYRMFTTVTPPHHQHCQLKRRGDGCNMWIRKLNAPTGVLCMMNGYETITNVILHLTLKGGGLSFAE